MLLEPGSDRTAHGTAVDRPTSSSRGSSREPGLGRKKKTIAMQFECESESEIEAMMHDDDGQSFISAATVG